MSIQGDSAVRGGQDTTLPPTPPTLGSPVRDAGPPGGRVSAALAVAMAGAITTVLRWTTAAGRTAFDNPDEAQQLAIARTLTGTTDWLTKGLTYRPGYSTLIAPIHWLTSDPETSYRMALAVNALLGGIAAILLTLYAARVTRIDVRWCAAFAVVASLVPGVFLQTNWAAAEPLIVPVFVATLIGASRFVAAPSALSGAVLVGLTAISYTVHGRLSPLVLSTVALIVAAMLKRRLATKTGVLLLAGAAVSTLLAMVYSTWAIDRTWVEIRDGNSTGSLAAKLGDPVDIALSGLGMTWYQLVTTVGIAGFGAWAVGSSLLDRAGASDPIGLSRRESAVLVVMTAPTAVVSTIFMTNATQAAHLLYGRYWESLAGPIVVLGLCYLGFAGRAAILRAALVVLGATLASGIALALVRQDNIDAMITASGTPGVGRRILGIVAYIGADPAIPVLRITLVASAITAVVAGIAAGFRSWPLIARWSVIAVACALAAIGIDRGQAYVDTRGEPVEEVATVAQLVEDGTIDPGVPISIRPAIWSNMYYRWMAFEFLLPENQIVPVPHGEEIGETTTEFVFAHARNPELRRSGYRIVWRDPELGTALWQRQPA